MIRGLALAVVLAAPALAQQAPQARVALDPQGPVTVGTALRVTATVLVPSYMPQPPVWPDLQVADAVTRLPERATHPVTQRVGQDSWSGVARTWEIIPQRAADYDLGAAEVTVIYADPETNAPVEVQLALPEIAFSATLPAGAEGMDPFLAATSLTLDATLDGPTATPKPGDAFTLTLTTTAEGPPAMLLPPLADRLPASPGLRAYPRQPALTDRPGERGGPPRSSRVEAIAYVIEAPGRYALPALTLDWWNTRTGARETATTTPVTIDVPAPPGWRAPAKGDAASRWRVWAWLALGACALAALGLAMRHLRRKAPRAPSKRALYRRLRRAARSGSTAKIRARLADWLARSPAPPPSAMADVETALRALDRAVYGPGPGGENPAARAALEDALGSLRRSSRQNRIPALPPLNPGLVT